MELNALGIDLVRYQGRQNFTLSPNEHLKIKIAEDMVLDVKVPQGKHWSGDVMVMFDEIEE